MYSIDMVKFLFENIAPGKPFHAALIEPGVYQKKGSTHTHDFREIMFVLKGRATHYVNDMSQTLVAGNLIMIRPTDAHTLRSVPGSEFTFINIAFPEAFWCRFLDLCQVDDRWATLSNPKVIEIPVRKRPHLEFSLFEAISAYRRTPSELHLVSALSACLAESPGNDLDFANAPEFLRTAMAAMQRQENLTLGIERFHELAGVSHSHLSRTMRLITGMSPTIYIHNLRMELAATLMTTTSMSVTEVADLCGFGNLSHFHRCFQKHFGVTPLKYRRSESQKVV